MLVPGSSCVPSREVEVDANTVIAVCSVVIAVVSLGVSAYVAWATREHNRLSVRPLLWLSTAFVSGTTAGLILTNSGPGPARIISSKLWFGDEELGEFNQPTVTEFKDRLKRERLLDSRPHAATLGGHPFLDPGLQRFLLSVKDYNPDADGKFARLIEGQLRLEIQYESIYDERFTAIYPDRQWASSPPAEDGP
jgi:hypothetical protein